MNSFVKGIRGKVLTPPRNGDGDDDVITPLARTFVFNVCQSLFAILGGESGERGT